MQRPDPVATTSLRKAVAEMRETLFMIAEAASRLDIPSDTSDLHGFIQGANYQLGEAERELAALSVVPSRPLPDSAA